MRNKRNNIKHNGEFAIDASKRLGGSKYLVSTRIRQGWSIEKAFSQPIEYKQIK